MGLNTIEVKLQKELPHLWYIGFFSPEAWESGEFTPGEEWAWFETFSEDIEDPKIPCEEKKKALKLLWRNIKKLLKEGYPPLTDDPERPQTHWWWHPELWSKNIDPLEVLKNVCPKA